MCQFCWSITVVLLLITTGLAYKFIIQGNVTEAADGRTAILLAQDERDLVLSRMKVIFSFVQHFPLKRTKRLIKHYCFEVFFVSLGIMEKVSQMSITSF